jgi:hypothetical protein
MFTKISKFYILFCRQRRSLDINIYESFLLTNLLTFVQIINDAPTPLDHVEGTAAQARTVSLALYR